MKDSVQYSRFLLSRANAMSRAASRRRGAAPSRPPEAGSRAIARPARAHGVLLADVVPGPSPTPQAPSELDARFASTETQFPSPASRSSRARSRVARVAAGGHPSYLLRAPKTCCGRAATPGPDQPPSHSPSSGTGAARIWTRPRPAPACVQHDRLSCREAQQEQDRRSAHAPPPRLCRACVKVILVQAGAARLLQLHDRAAGEALTKTTPSSTPTAPAPPASSSNAPARKSSSPPSTRRRRRLTPLPSGTPHRDRAHGSPVHACPAVEQQAR